MKAGIRVGRATRVFRRPGDEAYPAEFSVLLAMSRGDAADRIQARVEEAGVPIVMRADDAPNALRKLRTHPVDALLATTEIFEHLPDHVIPTVDTVVIGDDSLLAPMQRGAVDALPEEPSLDDVVDSLARIMNESRRLSEGPPALLAIASSPRGGATTVASQLATVSPGRRLLVDFALRAGVGERLAIESPRSVADLLPVAEELTRVQFEAARVSSNIPGLDVLLGAPLSAAMAFDRAAARAIVGAFRSTWDRVFVDVGSEPTPLGMAALEDADRVLLVVTPDGESIRYANAFVSRGLGDGVLDPAKVVAVINRVSRKAEVQHRLVQRLLEVQVARSILPASWWSLEDSINFGDPRLLRGARLERAFKELLKELSLA